MQSNDYTWVSATIPVELNQRLDAVCSHWGEKSALIRRAIKELVESKEKEMFEKTQQESE